MKNPLKSLGLIEDDAPSTTGEHEVVQDTKPAPRATVAAPFRPSVPSVDVGSVAPNPDVVTTLNDAANASKIAGYPEFRIIFDNIAGIPDNQKYPMSLKLLEASNKITPTALVASLQDRIQLVEKEQASFGQYYDDEVANTITSRHDQITKLETDVEKKKAEIRELDAKRVQLTQEAGQAQIQLEQTRAEFNASFDVVRSGFASELEKITSFIPAKGAK